jgi:hypothetical protein
MKTKPKTSAAKNKPAAAPKAAPRLVRKVIQVAPLQVGSPYLAIALCDDGTVWLMTQASATKTAIDELVNAPPPEPAAEPAP